jgi:hypothetical protein
MKIIVCGGRDYSDADRVDNILDKVHAKHTITLLIDGQARGADSLGHGWARSRGIPTKRFPADWDKHGKSAGYRRNEEMAAFGADAVVAFPGGRGTAHMLETAKRRGITVWEIED